MVANYFDPVDGKETMAEFAIRTGRGKGTAGIKNVQNLINSINKGELDANTIKALGSFEDNRFFAVKDAIDQTLAKEKSKR